MTRHPFFEGKALGTRLILRGSNDDSADCIPCLSHLKGKGGARETIWPDVIKMLFGDAEKEVHLDAFAA